MRQDAGPWTLAIDFGTSYTVAASRRPGQAAEIIEIDGERRVPSVVMITDDFGVVVGRAADEMAAVLPSRVLRAPKSRLGDPSPIVLGGKPYQIASLVAEMLAKVYDETVRHHGAPPESTRLTFPASWSGHRCQQLLRAAELAGLPEPELVPEPIAAAISYSDSVDTAPDSHVIVYDLGGGTVDCAVLAASESGFELVGRPSGDRQLGGELFDELLANRIGERLPPDVWEQLQLGEETIWRQSWVGLRREARRAKELLSAQPTADILVALPTGIREMRVTRADLDSVVGPHIADSVQLLSQAAVDADLRPGDLTSIYLAGGASRMPLVKTLITEAFPGVPISQRGDPKSAVALGATHPVATTSQGEAPWRRDHSTDPRRQVAAVAEVGEVPEVAGVAGVAGVAIDPPSTRVLAAWPSPETPAPAGRGRRRAAVIGIVVAAVVAICGVVAWSAIDDDDNRTASTSIPDTGATNEIGVATTDPPQDSAATTTEAVVTTTITASTTAAESTTSAAIPGDAFVELQSNAELTDFVAIVVAGGWEMFVRDTPAITVFAPTNAALGASLAAAGTSPAGVAASTPAAFQLVANHIVRDQLITVESEGSFTTLGGGELTLAAGTVDAVDFGEVSLQSTNAMIWVLDEALVPADFTVPSGPVTPTQTTQRPTTATVTTPTTPTPTTPSGTTATTASTTTPTTVAPTSPPTDPTIPPTTARTSGPVPNVIGDLSTAASSRLKSAGFANVTQTLTTNCTSDQSSMVLSYSPSGTQPFTQPINIVVCDA